MVNKNLLLFLSLIEKTTTKTRKTKKSNFIFQKAGVMILKTIAVNSSNHIESPINH